MRLSRRPVEETTIKIGVVGSGNMGSGMGKTWASKGHQVFVQLPVASFRRLQRVGRVASSHFTSPEGP